MPHVGFGATGLSPSASYILGYSVLFPDSDVPSGSGRERALASFMANFFPSIASSGSGVRSGASNAVSRALSNLANPEDSASSRERGFENY